jgi:hypothetical protein
VWLRRKLGKLAHAEWRSDTVRFATRLQSRDALVAVVIALVPITFRVPAVLVFIPPPVTLAPAALSCRV